MRAESRPSTLQHQKFLLFNHRNLATITLLRGTNKFAETIAAQAMTTLFDDDNLLVLEFLQTRWTSEAMLKPRENGQPIVNHREVQFDQFLACYVVSTSWTSDFLGWLHKKGRRTSHHFHALFVFGRVFWDPEVHRQTLLLGRAIVVIAAELVYDAFHLFELFIFFRFHRIDVHLTFSIGMGLTCL